MRARSAKRPKKVTFDVPDYLQELKASLPLLLLFQEAAELLRMHPRTLHRYIANGSIRAMRSMSAGASRVLISRSEILRFLSERSK